MEDVLTQGREGWKAEEGRKLGRDSLGNGIGAQIGKCEQTADL